MLFRITNAAIADLKGIALYTEKTWGIAQRNLYLERLDRAFHQLAAQPGLGQPCDYIRAGYRKYPEAKHNIFYRIAQDHSVEIIRIFHQHMEPLLHLARPLHEKRLGLMASPATIPDDFDTWLEEEAEILGIPDTRYK